MDIYDDKHAYLVLLRSEHRNVNETLRLVSTAMQQLGYLNTNDSQLAQMIEHLTRLRQDLEHHFLVEESDGCLDEAVARCPGLGHEVDSITAEHPRLIEQLDALITLATRLANDESAQSNFIRQWERFVAELGIHENAEERLLQQGLESVPTKP